MENRSIQFRPFCFCIVVGLVFLGPFQVLGSQATEGETLDPTLSTLLETIEQIQNQPGGIPTLTRAIDQEILQIEEKVRSLDQDLAGVRARFELMTELSPREGSVHWAYQFPVAPEIPSTRFRDLVRNPIDAFVYRRLEDEGWAPSPEATREKLIRRVFLDLIGLPPTIEELEAFLNDSSPSAYDKVVDRLLDSPHFGEHQARFWLDLARCSDSCGYHIDANRPMWPYRDWVIEAFNRDLPYDQFTIEQLAGDLLPDADSKQRIATGFHRNTLFNEEGGIDPEEFRVKAVIDRVGTTATVWMGTTMACAECHDHKYDPITQKEFYQLFAFFNTTSELGGGTFATRAPLIHLYQADQEKEVADLTVRIGEMQKQLETHTPDLAHQQSLWEESMKAGIGWEHAAIEEGESVNGATLELQEDGSLAARGISPSTDIYRIEGIWTQEKVTAMRLEILPSEQGTNSKRFGRHENGVPALGEIRLMTGPRDGSKEVTTTALLFPSWNTENQQPKRVLDGNLRSGWILNATDMAIYEAWFEIPDSASFPGGTRFTVDLDQRAGEESTFSRFRLTLTDTVRPIRIPPKEIRDILGLPNGFPERKRGGEKEVKLANLSIASDKGAPSKRSFEQELKLAEYFRSIAPTLDPVREQLSVSTREKDDLLKRVPQALIMGESMEPRETHLHIRGDFLRPGEKVEANIPAIFGRFPTDLPKNRLGLARWLVSPENPLAARVAVNRFWQQVFGRGIVETSEDFGLRGTAPSHPELLDWLALEFIQRGWSTKEMMRLIVTSSVYRQSSNVGESLLEQDPYNRLLARAPRFRLAAESIRDQALAVSGLLNRVVGGASVFPWQPPGLWSEIGSPGYGVDEWIPSEGSDRFKRGLYTYWRRSNPYPAFITFDAPTREYCTVKRSITNTPLQALVTLNDPVFLEAATGFAARLMSEMASSTPEKKIERAFRLCLCRYPTEWERGRLLALFETQLERFRADPSRIEGMAASLDLDHAATPELAAWTLVCQAILNLDETLTKG